MVSYKTGYLQRTKIDQNVSFITNIWERKRKIKNINKRKYVFKFIFVLNFLGVDYISNFIHKINNN